MTALEGVAVAAAPSAGVVPGEARPNTATSTAVAFERDVGGNTDIYVIPLGGGVERRLTRHAARDILPRWSADGSKIYFSTERSGHWQVFEVDAKGGEPRIVRLAPDPGWQADPSSDGSLLAVVAELETHDALVGIDARGRSRTLVEHGGRARLGNPHWSRDRLRVVFSSNKGVGGHRIYLLDVAVGEDRRLSPLSSGGCEPRFRPDGLAIAYVRRQRRTRDRSWIVEQQVDGGAEKMLVDWPALNYDPVYSLDGTELAFASDVAGGYAVYRLRLSDGKSWRLTFGDGAARHPDYKPTDPLSPPGGEGWGEGDLW